MFRSLLLIGGLVLTAATALSLGLHQSGGASNLLALIKPLPEITETFQRGFRSDTMLDVNQKRRELSVETLRVDEEIQRFVHDFVAQHPDPSSIDLEEVFDALQREFPGAQYLAANLVSSTNREDLVRTLQKWDVLSSDEFSHISTGVFVCGRKLGVLGVVSRRLPQFSLQAANAHGGRFFNQCPHCQRTHALTLDRKSRTLILSCPDCKKPFDVLAADSHGTIRRATDFMSGFALPQSDEMRLAQSPEERILAVWQRIARQCEYEHDQNGKDAYEAWKIPEETWKDRAGDCEDTSILLADALISAGFEARVAIGWNGNIGQHAWTVVKVDDTRQYVLESTFDSPLSFQSMVSAAEAAPFYQPEQLFDRGHLYFLNASPDQGASNYFSGDIWHDLATKKESNTPIATDIANAHKKKPHLLYR